MDTRDRALLDLQGVVKTPKISTQPRYAPLESRYLKFKQRVNGLMQKALGADGCQQFLERYFVEFLPALLQAAAEHEQLDQIACAEERSLLEQFPIAQSGLLSHSPMLFSLNRKAFQQVPPGSPSLDLGIGTGQNSRFSLGDRSLSFGADIMVSNLLRARSLGRHEKYAALDMAALPFLGGSFERVYALNCIYHAQAGRLQTLEEISRVLAPGGILALTDTSEYLNSMKPLTTFFRALGFDELASEFDGYFLSGYGADGSHGVESWYREHLPGLGFEGIHLEFLLSPRLSNLAYLFYDWQALFNLNAQACFASPAGNTRFLATYRPMLISVVAPLLKMDRELCRQANRGGSIFVTARKRTTAAANTERDVRWACPACRVLLTPQLKCTGCGRTYPEVEGIPLLTSFYADGTEGAHGGYAKAS